MQLLELKWTSQVLGNNFDFKIVRKTFPKKWNGNFYKPCATQRLFLPVNFKALRVPQYPFHSEFKTVCTIPVSATEGGCGAVCGHRHTFLIKFEPNLGNL